ncbi:PucR family transcriptional regulator [Nocardioides dongxiaopingii]|uniref:PucR family transcriptional regulator n=1 Tax=Nocardioides dongxiaopingii TaxID=2576036 RepID=UPI0010C76E14|nr:helix-turn-helix domain-containing protein [Nocardioides dongxiaopingii]
MLRLDEVAAAAAGDAGGIDPGLLGDFLPIVVEAAASGRRLRRTELRACGEHGAAAALVGVPLRALVDLYLSACWRLWEELDTGPDAVRVRAAGLAVLRAADDAVAALAEGFQLARNDLSRQQESTRRDVFDLLLAGGPAAVEATGRAADLGLDLTSPHAVLVARHDLTFDHPSLTSVPRRLEGAVSGRHGDTSPLVATRNGLLVCIFAAPDRASVTLVGERLATVVAEATSAGGASDPGAGPRRAWQAAIGRTRPGAGAVRVSYEQAGSALDLAERLGLEDAVIDSGSLVVYEVLLRDRAAIDELITAVLGPLHDVPGSAAAMVETLEAYFACGGVATATATRLHLSVRAVTYRLQRIGDVLGLDPTDPAHRFTLHAAVLGARLLGTFAPR